MKLFKQLFKFIYNLFGGIFSTLSIILALVLLVVTIIETGTGISNDTINIVSLSWFVLFLNLILANAAEHLRQAGIGMENSHLKSAGTLLLWSQILIALIAIITLVSEYHHQISTCY